MFMSFSHATHASEVVKCAFLCTWAHYYIQFHPVTSGVLKGVLMEMAVCSTAFNSRQLALCIHSGVL